MVCRYISRINYQHSGSRPEGTTPREAFSGQQVAGTRDFRLAFGDYCQCTVANTDNSMNPRTEDCVVYLPTGNRAGSVKMLSVATYKIKLQSATNAGVYHPDPQPTLSKRWLIPIKDSQRVQRDTIQTQCGQIHDAAIDADPTTKP